jgi:DNA alkylation repair enzyme
VNFSADPDAGQLTAELRAAGSAQRAASEQNYLKSTMDFSGTTVPAIRAIVTTWRRAHPDLTGSRLTALATALWDGPVFERKLTGGIRLADRRALLQQGAHRVVPSHRGYRGARR